MFTAKRFLILGASLFVCLCGYTIYTVALGVIDGWQALPSWMLADGGPESPLGPGPTDQKLEMAFGAGCEERRRPLKLWHPEKGIAFAAGDFGIEGKDGRVRLAPFSAAIFHKAKTPGAYADISTVKCDVAILTLDRPVSNHTELANRKVIAVELQGGRPGVTLGNNRASAEKNDDIDILILNGSLFYEERRNLIWTEGVVCLTDHQSKPPIVVRGKHLEMHLAKDLGPNRPKGSAKVQQPRAESDTNNIEKILLHADVEMRFWVDAKAGFLGGVAPAKTAKRSSSGNPGVPQPSPEANSQEELYLPDKAQMIVKTGGAFSHDLLKDIATFESPPAREDKPGSGADPLAPDQVHVQRLQKVDGEHKLDQLTCDRLDLVFRRKTPPGAVSARTTSGNKEIETARATARSGNDVALALESEGMVAYSNELFFRAGDLVNGPLMILKGEPLRSFRDGHTMKCKELHLFGANRAGEGQRAWARGPGQIDLLNAKNADKEEYPTHILWQDTLSVVKEKEADRVYDLMTVGGDASFIDDQQMQQLHGEKIMVWVENKREGAKRTQTSGGNRQELHRVFAQDRVRAVSPEFVIRQCNRLNVTFLPEVAQEDRLPDLADVKMVSKNAPPVLPGNASMPTIKPLNSAGPIVPLEASDKKARPPIELSGNDITMAVTTLGTKKQLQELVAKGGVHVVQPGDAPGEKRMDITGQLLTVRKLGEKGDVLTVHGDQKSLARLESGDRVLWGPIVTINQAENRTLVDGNGAMEMPSNKNLDGTETTKKNTRITIGWNKGMTFDGRTAIFSGGVQAHENGAPSRLQCQEMWAILDQTVSFKEGEKRGQSAKIDRIWCDKNVYVDDIKVDDKKQFVQQNTFQGTVLSIDAQAGPTNLAGPAQVKLLARGQAGLEIGPPPGVNAPPAQAKMEWKLTHVKFRDRMFSNTKAETRNAKFFGEHAGVEVFHFPTNKINDTMDPDNPPKDGLYLRCEILEIDGKQNLGRVTQVMIAQRNVHFRTDQYLGYADLVKYDEASDTVIFQGLNGNVVRLYRFIDGRPQPESVNSTKVLYNRKTGKLETEGVRSITN